MRIIEDTKTSQTKLHTAIQSRQCSDHTAADARRKMRIHVICILVAGTVSVILVACKIGSPLVLGYGPAAPSIVQELFDRMFRL